MSSSISSGGETAQTNPGAPAFLELFQGKAGLTAAVTKICGSKVVHLSAPKGPLNNANLADDAIFEQIISIIVQKRVTWWHAAPPCQTFSTARRADAHATCRVLRTRERPEGFNDDPEVEIANKLAKRTAELAKLSLKNGTLFSIENPLSSIMWDLKDFKQVMSNPEVRSRHVDQCMFGSIHKKPTAVVTNINWISDRPCSQEIPHRHVPLVGMVLFNGHWTWRTKLAAEYPTAMCEAWATEFLKFINAKNQTSSEDKAVTEDAKGTTDILKEAPVVSEPRPVVSEPEFLGGVGVEARGARREFASDACFGGLRNPNRAVARSAPLRETGGLVRKILALLSQNPLFRQELIAVAEGLGTSTSTGFKEDTVKEFRKAIFEHFGGVGSTPGRTTQVYDVDLWTLLLTKASDPDAVEVPRWLSTGCPSGIGTSKIVATGVFPETEGQSSAIRASQDHAKQWEAQGWRADGHKNYTSFYEDGAIHAKTEIARIIDKGFLEQFKSWEEVTARWPTAVASRVAVLTKTRDDGTIKIRLVIDLRRSGGNAWVELPERVVLPRLSDLIASIIDLMEAPAEEDTGFEVVVADFEDAFHTVAIQEEARGTMAIKTVDGWGVFKVMCCGMAGAPLVWCRIAAAATRIAQACFLPEELRLQVFVDDPAVAVRGSRSTRSWLIGALLLLWTTMGFRFNWGKAHRGTSVPWIGAQISVEKRRGLWGVLAELQGRKLNEMKQNLDFLHNTKGMINIDKLKTVAGQLSWASGLFPWVRSFNASLWAAITAHEAEQYLERYSAKKRPTQLIFLKRVEEAIRWTRLLFAGLIRTPHGNLQLSRWTDTSSRSAETQLCIRTDASPWGFGAILFRRGAPIHWMAGTWMAEDIQYLNATAGDPAWQAEWELYAVLLAVDAWLGHLWGNPLAVIQMDATAALHAVMRAAGRTPAMNAIASEIALRLEIAGVQFLPEHLSGTLNFDCDALSRLHKEGIEVPKKLVGIPRTTPKDRVQSFFWGSSSRQST